MAHKKIPPFLQADDYFAIVPDNSVNFADDATNNPQGYPIAAIYVGTTGNISLVSPTPKADLTDNVVLFVGVPAGAVLPILAKRVKVTGTTASNLVGLVGMS